MEKSSQKWLRLPYQRCERKYIWVFIMTLSFTLIFNTLLTTSFAENSRCNCVIFRLDDVQDYFLNNIQMQLINTFKEKNIDLTIGVIGNNFGQDPNLFSFLKTTLKNNGSTLEIANHGWNHEDFTQYDKNNQSILMKKTNEKIHHLLGIRPDIFIPPFNSMNNNTISAAEENNIHYISSNKSNSFLLNVSNSIVNLYPSSSVTGIQRADYSWVNLSIKQIFNNIIKDIENQGYSVITVHPQEYSIRNGTNFTPHIDVNKIEELEILLDNIKNEGFRSMTLSELNVKA